MEEAAGYLACNAELLVGVAGFFEVSVVLVVDVVPDRSGYGRAGVGELQLVGKEWQWGSLAK